MTQNNIYPCLQQYSQLRNLSVGPVSYAEENEKFLHMIICKKSYMRGSVEPSEESYDIDAQLETGYTFYRKCKNIVAYKSYFVPKLRILVFSSLLGS